MREEMKFLMKNQTGTLVACRWPFKKNESILGVEQPRYKSRLVAKGFTQRQGVDYTEIFSPMLKHPSIRVLLSILASKDLELD